MTRAGLAALIMLAGAVAASPASAKGRAGAKFAATVPVYFHVITAGAAGRLTDAQIADQISVLNRTFAGGEGGTRTGFSFALAGVTRTENAAWFYAGPGGNDEHSMKAALHRGGANALNLYTRSSRPARRSACATPGCSIARADERPPGRRR